MNLLSPMPDASLLEGKADWIKLQGNVDRWLGGVHLTGEQSQWRWDHQNHTLIAA